MSLQSRASLTAHFKTNEIVMQQIITKILKEKFGIHYFFDHSHGLVVALKMLFKDITLSNKPIIVSECPA